MTRPTRLIRLPRRRCLAAALLILPLAPWAVADAVKLSGFWIENVQVHKIEDGKVIYLGPAGSDIEADLANLQGLRLDAYPALSEGLDAAEAGEIGKGIEALRKVYRDAKEPWLKRFLEWKLSDLYNKQNDGPNALRFYLALVKANAHASYLDRPPINAAAATPPAQGAKLLEELKTAAESVNDELTRQHLATLVELIPTPAEAQPTPPSNGEPATPTRNDNGTAPVPAQATTVAAGGIVLPTNPPDSPTVALLKQGQLSKALESAQRDVQVVGGLSEKIFYKGLIQRAIADAAKADDPRREQLYKDAGLSFMRVVIHFPKSRYAPLALLEVGYVHEQIGEADQAARLYEEVANAITPEDDPNYHARMLALTGSESPTP